MRKKYNKSIILTLTAIIFMISGCSTQQKQNTSMTSGESETQSGTTVSQEAEFSSVKQQKTAETVLESDAADSDYLKTYFQIEIGDNQWNSVSFSKALKLVAGEEAPQVEGELTWLSAAKAAVEAADFKELALSYPAKKVAQRLKLYGVTTPVDAQYAPYLACALDANLITSEEVQKAMTGKAFTAADSNRLLMKIADANGDARNYLGMASDPEIYGKIDHAWNSFLLFDDAKLSEIGRQAVQKKIVTGYGMKSAFYNARFLPELTLQYGHSDIKHAHQLIGLLNSEGIDAKVQLEPKVSIYQYLPEWGAPPEKTPTYEVKQFGDLSLVNAVEYDMEFEFNNQEDMLRFDKVMKEYAKKNKGNEEAAGLIYGSWWQPLYSSFKAGMPEGDYHLIYDCVITNGSYSIHPFTLPENKDKVEVQLKELAGNLEVTPVERYCNTAFYHYLAGEDYQ